jgi:Transposase, Mutator family
MTTRELAEHVSELYGAEISPDLVSAVTEAVLEWRRGRAAAWTQPMCERCDLI